MAAKTTLLFDVSLGRLYRVRATTILDAVKKLVTYEMSSDPESLQEVLRGLHSNEDALAWLSDSGIEYILDEDDIIDV